jgi:hypothetical protein
VGLRQGLAALAFAAAAGGAAAQAAPARPMVIAPVIEGLLACDPKPPPEFEAMIHERSYCVRHGRDVVRALNSLLDELEPGGPRGEVQVGYTLTVHLLALYRQQPDGQWALDERQVQRVLELLRRVERPVVLYLMANHFDTTGAITQHLAADPRNVMRLADGSAPNTNYFGYPIVSYTLLADESIPVNRYRFDALRQLAQRVAALPPHVRQRIVGVTLAGEVHHMFSNFEGGMGRYDVVRVTDYSPASIVAFRRWLERKYGTISAFRFATGSSAASFGAVAPPGRDLLAEGAAGNRSEHFDGHAEGLVPISGWLWDPHKRVQSLELHVDGRPMATLPSDFNRLDVYRAIEAVDEPSIGFRHDLDYSGWRPGRYALQVVARTASGAHELARRTLVVTGQPGKAGFWARITAQRARPTELPMLSAALGVRAVLDLPHPTSLRVLYNPLARDWNAFRALQVIELIGRFHTTALAAGLPADRLYSHQILSRVNSTWNPQFFAVDSSLAADLPWKTGFNTYGGAAGGGWTERFVREQRLLDYGVPEFHPQQWKKPDAASRALALHRRLGARFVSPYHLSLVADQEASGGHAIQRMDIRPNNPRDGSDQLYRAIREAASQ